MNRRWFLKRLLAGLQALFFMRLTPLAAKAVAATGDGGTEAMHYRPLNGQNLREMALQRIHHTDGGFTNPMSTVLKGGLGPVLKWKLLSRNRFAKDLKDQPVTKVTIDWDVVRDHDGVCVTFIKHSALMIKIDGRYLLVDPVFGEIFGFIKDFSPLENGIEGMPAPNHVLITHGHYDHLDASSLKQLNPDTHIISPLGYDTLFRKIGMGNRSQLDWYETFSDGCRVTLVPANHWTMRNPIVGPNRSLWGGYVIEAPSGYTIYISGDTAYFDGFEQIGREFDIDLAILNLGAYEPRWFMAPSHINPRETVQAFTELGADKLMVIHWGTFQLGDEPVHFPPIDIEREMTDAGLIDHWVDLRLGQTFFVS